MFEDLTVEDLDPTQRRALATELSGRLAEQLQPEPIRTPMNLYKITSELKELYELLAEAIGDDNEAEAVAIQVQIGRYLGAEVAKVDSYHGLLKFGNNLIEQIKAEEERLYKSRKVIEAIIERVKSAAVFVMKAMGLKRLEGSHGRRLRLQKSPVSVEVTDPVQVPDRFVMVPIKLPMNLWKLLRNDIRYIGEIAENGTPEISLSRIKAVIEAGQVCLECKGDLDWTGTRDDGIDCPRCEGSGRIPGDVPGAHLVTTNFHLRCE